MTTEHLPFTAEIPEAPGPAAPDLPRAADLLARPDHYRALYTEQLRQAQISAHGAKIMLRKIEVLTREDDEIEGYRSFGLPEPKPHIRRVVADEDAPEPVPVTRKPQVVALLSQQPGQPWSVRQVGEALGIENQKSLRVTLEEMVKAGTLVKTPDTRYKYAGEQLPVE